MSSTSPTRPIVHPEHTTATSGPSHASDTPQVVSQSEARLCALLDEILDYYVEQAWRRMSETMLDAVSASCTALDREQGYTGAYRRLVEACDTLDDRSTAMRRAVRV